MKALYLALIACLTVGTSVALAHKPVVHRPLAEKAWDKMGFTPDISSLATAKARLIDGAEDEDADTSMRGTDDQWHEVTRPSLHGYSPLTSTSDGVFGFKWNHVDYIDWSYPWPWPAEVPHRTARQRAMDLWQNGVRDEATYSNMQTAFLILQRHLRLKDATTYNR